MPPRSRRALFGTSHRRFRARACVRIVALVSCTIALHAAMANGQAVERPIDWATTFRTDLQWAYEVIRDNHPGSVDPANPAFRLALERGQAEASIATVQSEAAYVYALKRFIVGLGDTHTTLFVDFGRIPARWAGIVVQWRGERAVVIDREPGNTPPLGSEMVSCEGAPFTALVDRELTFQGHPLAHSRRRQAATWALVDGSNPFAPPPASCDVVVHGVRSTWRLTWRPFDSGTFRRLIAAVRLGAATERIDEVAPGIFWIGIPTFDGQSVTLRSFVDTIAARRDVLRNARAVVFDVRGNGGGSSAWGDEIVAALWNEAPTVPGSASGSAVDWRATESNAGFIASIIPELRGTGTSPDVLALLTRVEAGMRGAIAAGRPYWRQEGDTTARGGLTKRRPTGVSSFPAKVVLLTDDGCASACLNFADRLLAKPGVTHVGMVTGADNLYIDKRAPVTSPSGHARLDYSLKVYRGRPRGDMEAYTPDITYAGEWTTTALRVWILDLLERNELSGARPHNTAGAQMN